MVINSAKIYSNAETSKLRIYGEIDFFCVRRAVEASIESSNYSKASNSILDLRGAKCQLSVAEVYCLAEYMAYSEVPLTGPRKIAVAIEARDFNHAKLSELCAQNRGMHAQSFHDIESVGGFLAPSDLPDCEVAEREIYNI